METGDIFTFDDSEMSKYEKNTLTFVFTAYHAVSPTEMTFKVKTSYYISEIIDKISSYHNLENVQLYVNDRRITDLKEHCSSFFESKVTWMCFVP